jgi:hypothetical protein
MICPPLQENGVKLTNKNAKTCIFLEICSKTMKPHLDFLGKNH